MTEIKGEMPKEIFITEVQGSSDYRQGMWMEETFKNPLNDIEYGEHYTRTSETIDSLLERSYEFYSQISFVKQSTVTGGWGVFCFRWNDGEEVFFSGKTPAEAIRAALLSLEGEK